MGRFAAFNEASLDMPSNCLCRSRQLARIDFVPTRCSRLESASMDAVAWSPHTPGSPGLLTPRKRQHGCGGMVSPHPDRHTVPLGCACLESASMGTVACLSPHPDRHTVPLGCSRLESILTRMSEWQTDSHYHDPVRRSDLRIQVPLPVSLSGNPRAPSVDAIPPYYSHLAVALSARAQYPLSGLPTCTKKAQEIRS